MRLPAALALSLLLHALVVAGGLGRSRPAAPPPEPPPLQATLAAPHPPAELIAPDAANRTEAPPPPQHAEPKPPRETRLLARPTARPEAPPRKDDPVAAASRQIVRALLYPPEAVARGLEGEAVVMLFLDETGNAVAARLERSSGHALLDNAAVAAARQVRALPDGAAREIVLPVRFRLR